MLQTTEETELTMPSDFRWHSFLVSADYLPDTDLKRLGRGFRNFEHFRNRFLFATRQTPVLNGVSDYNPVTYYEEDDF